MNKSLAQVYAASMAHHPFGHALYEPSSPSTLGCGSLGYLDSQGQWTHLLDLTNSQDLAAKGLPPIQDTYRYDDPMELRWGPKPSKHVKHKQVDFKGALT
jgi:hypothetical protein